MPRMDTYNASGNVNGATGNPSMKFWGLIKKIYPGIKIASTFGGPLGVIGVEALNAYLERKDITLQDWQYRVAQEIYSHGPAKGKSFLIQLLKDFDDSESKTRSINQGH